MDRSIALIAAALACAVAAPAASAASADEMTAAAHITIQAAIKKFEPKTHFVAISKVRCEPPRGRMPERDYCGGGATYSGKVGVGHCSVKMVFDLGTVTGVVVCASKAGNKMPWLWGVHFKYTSKRGYTFDRDSFYGSNVA